MKRFVSMLAAMIMVLSLFSGVALAEDRITITIMRDYIAPPEADGEILKYMCDKYNVDFQIIYIERDKWDESISTKFAKGEIGDIIDVKGLDKLYTYVDQGLLAELSPEFLKENAPFLYNDYIKEDEKHVLRYTTINGKNYGLPNISANSFHKVIMWRGDWLKTLGFDKAPETLDEMEKAVYAIANNDPDGNGVKDTYGLSKTGMEMVYGAFGYLPELWQERDGKLVFGAVQPEVKEALTTLAKWFKDGVIDPEYVTGENQGGYYAISHSFNNNRIGLTSLGDYYHWKPVFYPGDSKSETYLELQKANPAALESLMYGTPVKGPQGKAGMKGASAINALSTVGFGVQLESDPEKFAKILQIYNEMSASYENYLESIFGIKGTHWDFDATTGFPGLINENDSKSVARLGIVAGFECSEYTYKRAQPRIDWAYEKKLDQDAISDQLLVPLASAGEYQDELNKLRDETFTKIIRGDLPVDAFDTFVTEWFANGGQQLTDEANAWYATIEK
ncbi:MAG: extracellular solute-binding protein [Clostridia bacterium]